MINAIHTKLRLIKNVSKQNRKLEIGPGDKRIPGFETINIVRSAQTDYVLDAATSLPFANNTFEVLYASHILEHIPWFLTSNVLKEWARIIKPGGTLEVWVPDGLKIAKAFVDAEGGNDYLAEDGWFRFNDKKDPCVWASGRIFTYGDGSNNIAHPNWHHAIFSYRYLRNLFEEAGFKNITKMDATEVRGFDHRWINLGIKGYK